MTEKKAVRGDESGRDEVCTSKVRSPRCEVRTSSAEDTVSPAMVSGEVISMLQKPLPSRFVCPEKVNSVSLSAFSPGGIM